MEETTTARALKEEGRRLFEEGLYEEAATKFGQAQEMFAVEGNEVEVAEMVNNLGLIHQSHGEWDKAIAAIDEARATFVRLGDRSREAQALANLSRPYSRQGDLDKAKECLRQAADIFDELGDEQRKGETLVELGKQMWRAGKRGDGLAAYEAGLQTLEKPTAAQKTVKGLLNLRARLQGGRK
jgi:tetratricopeptide (TPR) repeat protein